jgi:hypothetical protein
MSYDSFLNNLDGLISDVYSSALDIETLPNFDNSKESKKKLAKTLYLNSNPYSTKEDSDLIFDSEEELLAKLDREYDNIIPEIDENESESKKEQKKRIRAEKKKEKELKKQEIKEIKNFYNDSSTEKIYDEVDVIKEEFRKSSFMLSKHSVDLGVSIGLAMTTFATTIPAIVVDVAPLSFNVPGAANRLISVVSSLFDIVRKLEITIGLLDGFKKISIISDANILNTVGITLNPFIIALKSLLTPINLLFSLIRKLIDAIKKIFTDKKKIFKKATKQLRKLGHLPKRNGKNRGDKHTTEPDSDEKLTLGDGTTPITVWAKDEDDIEEVISLLDRFLHHEVKYKGNDVWEGKKKWLTTGYVYAFRQEKIEIDLDGFGIEPGEYDPLELIEKIENKIKESEIPIKVDINEDNSLQGFVYDIELPDGTIIPNISEEGLEYFKSKYILTFK